jgi:hypothetical protein
MQPGLERGKSLPGQGYELISFEIGPNQETAICATAGAEKEMRGGG